MKIKVEKLSGVPITVVLKTAPCIWEIASNPHAVFLLGDLPDPPRCLVARDVEPKPVQWEGVTLAGAPPAPRYFEARKVRDQFMSLKSERDFLNFLNRIGPFCRLAEAERRRGWQLRDFIGCQKLFAQLLTRSPENWRDYADTLLSRRAKFNVLGIISALNIPSRHTVEFGSSYKIKIHWQNAPQISWRGAKHLAVIETTDIVSAILTTIELDHLRGAKFALCSRPDCSESYEITSKHKRKYCSIACAHLESVRSMRRRQKRRRGSKQKPKPGNV